MRFPKKMLPAMLFFALVSCGEKPKSPLSIIAYYAGDATHIEAYPIEKLTHIIFSFVHLKGNELAVGSREDSLTLQKLTSLKQRNPGLKIILSLGGWGGCETCSEVFSSDQGRREFAASVLKTARHFGTDGIDLDWEYPVIPGFPKHRYAPEDKENFTALVKILRQTLGQSQEINFAAGGFTEYLQKSIEWDKIAPLIDKVNLMTYDLVHGNSKVTGHHTPLYSTPLGIESADHAVKFLDSIRFPLHKLVIGAAFYARVFEAEVNVGNGLYQPGKFNFAINYRDLKKDSLEKSGFNFLWDDIAKAPYAYNQTAQQLITYDDKRSLALKTQYAIKHKLNGIMFWELSCDEEKNGLLDAIYDTANGAMVND